MYAKLILAIVAVLGVVLGSYFVAGRVQAPDSVACTQEAMLCPDGSAVGRMGPTCEFAACPGEAHISAIKNGLVVYLEGGPVPPGEQGEIVAGYQIVFGDGTKDTVDYFWQSCPAIGECERGAVNEFQASHDYKKAGRYEVALMKGTTVVATTSVTVSGKVGEDDFTPAGPMPGETSDGHVWTTEQGELPYEGPVQTRVFIDGKFVGAYDGSCHTIEGTNWQLLPGESSGVICWYGGGGKEIGLFGNDVRVGDLDEGSAEVPGVRGNFKTAFTLSAKIQDCPEDWIDNEMPIAYSSNQTPPREYYIYQGERRELTEFDMAWVASHCDLQREVVE